MYAGLFKYVFVNFRDIESVGFKEGEEVSLELLKKKGIINLLGRERILLLKVRMFFLFKNERVLFVNRCVYFEVMWNFFYRIFLKYNIVFNYVVEFISRICVCR